MSSHIKFAAGLALIVAHDIHSQIKARRQYDFYLQACEDFTEIDAAYQAQIRYLIHLLEENGVEPSEFDLIALHYPISS